LDRQLRIRKFTPAISNIFNLNNSLVGSPLSQIKSNIISDKSIELSNMVLENSEPSYTEVRTINGFWYLEQVLPYRDAKNNMCGVILSFIDITQQKEVETQISESLAKERDLNELKSRFVAMASHEFRTPLTTVQSSAKLILRYPSGDEDQFLKREKHVKKILGAVNGLNTILEDFLSISRIEEGKIEIRKSNESLSNFCSELTEMLSGIAKEGQSFHCTHLGEDSFSTDFDMLKKIMSNLLSNAIKYSAEGQKIDILTQNKGKILELEVNDYGIGIPKEEQGKIFERFFRAANATNIEGTGLGLHIVKKYVEILGGTISFYSIPNIQTCFKIEIPNMSS
jgi:signal transduction histidine kinase